QHLGCVLIGRGRFVDQPGEDRLPLGRCCAGTCRSWPTPARSACDQQRRQVLAVRAARVAGLTPCRTCVLLNFLRTDFWRAPCGGRALMGGKPLLCVFVTASGGSLYPCLCFTLVSRHPLAFGVHPADVVLR